MISVVIPTLDAEKGLPAALSALVDAAVEGVVREVIVADAGSRDATQSIAEEMGATFLVTPKGRGTQLAAGAQQARHPWLLFLHADTVLEPGWVREACEFMRRIDDNPRAPRAASFRLGLDDIGIAPRAVEGLVQLRRLILALPYGDQGLLIPRRLYDEIGGYCDLPIMEDVDIVGRIGRKRLVALRSRALTSAERYRAEGYLARIFRNQTCLAMYFLGVSPSRIARRYQGRSVQDAGAAHRVKSA
jgi:rSAM/selenodomain-associated transferase 2